MDYREHRKWEYAQIERDCKLKEIYSKKRVEKEGKPKNGK